MMLKEQVVLINRNEQTFSQFNEQILVYHHLSRYCAKVIQTKFVAFLSLFSRISIEISEMSDAFWKENHRDFVEGKEISLWRKFVKVKFRCPTFTSKRKFEATIIRRNEVTCFNMFIVIKNSWFCSVIKYFFKNRIVNFQRLIFI